MGAKNRTSPVSPRSAADITRLNSRSARSRGDMLLMSGAGIDVAASEPAGDEAAFFWAVMRASQTAEKIATAEPARIQGNDRPGATPDNRRPQDWQNLDPARISASQRRQRWVISAAPQL